MRVDRVDLRSIGTRALRLALWLASISLFASSSVVAQPLTAFGRRKVEAMLRTQLPCLGCHAFGSEGGRLAPDLKTVRERRSPEYIAAMVDDPQRVLPGAAMPKTIMPATVREAVVRFLVHQPGNGNARARASSIPSDQSGPALYARWCASCHGAQGRGDGPNAAFLPTPPAKHADAAAMSRRTDDALYDTIAGGGGVMNRSPRMPSFAGTLAPNEVRALVDHIRVLCKCRGPSWSAP